MANPQQQPLRALVRGAYDVQSLRIEMGNRICASFRSKLGLAPSQKEEEDKEAQKILDTIRESFKKITDGVKRELPSLRQFKGDEIISTYTELCLVSEYLDLEISEDKHFRRMGNVLESFPIYTEYLKGIKGCGPAMSGVLISEINIEQAEYPSSLWKYAGLDVARYYVCTAPNGAPHIRNKMNTTVLIPEWDTLSLDKYEKDGYTVRDEWSGRSRRDEHLVRVKFTNREGKEQWRNSITFNPFLKTKLTGVLAGCLLKSRNETYSAIYANAKLRYENHQIYGIANDERRIEQVAATFTKGGKKKKYSPKFHRHNMALRYMVKMFLLDLYKAWRALEGLPVAPSYSEAKLGKTHGVA